MATRPSSCAAAIALFTSDLRLHDQPVLRAALHDARTESGAGKGAVVPLFVLDDGVRAAEFAVPNRMAFLADCLADLDWGLRQRGGRLVVRSGPAVAEVCRVVAACGARRVHVAAGVSRYADRREDDLRRELATLGAELVVHAAVVTAVPPGLVTPSGGRDHFAVFTPYHRAWAAAATRAVHQPPRRVSVPHAPSGAVLPERSAVPGVSPGVQAGGERAGRARILSWLRGPVRAYGEQQDDLAADATSRLSADLHFGSVSPLELVRRAQRVDHPGAAALVRQLAWRDFHHQVLAARPECAEVDYRHRGDRWRNDPREIEAWQQGRTGFPVVDAAMRQLVEEGFVHNRGRLLAASFLTKTLWTDWRVGARYYLDLLVDGDIANNQLNWQWVAGTGTDTRPNRVLNPLVQARRFDPDGNYVRRWVPELAGVPGRAVHQPWRLPLNERARLDYSEPMVDLDAARRRFLTARRSE